MRVPEIPTVRVGMVGTGFVARIHAEAYRQVRGARVELSWVAATRPERAAAFAREFGGRQTTVDARAIFADPAVDVVDLCVPTHLHAPLAVEAARAGKHVIVEKPLTGFFGPAVTPRAEMLRQALAAADAVIGACRDARVRLCYAENWVYAPPIQKARRLLAASGGPILRLVGEESHSGTHAPINKRWETGGGGSLIGKGCHPLGAALYLKADEGRRSRGAPIRPVSVLAEVAQLADTAAFRASVPRYLNTVEGADVEDWGSMLVVFDDGSVAQISASDAVLGGIRNQLAVYGAKAVVFCNINPNDAVQAYAPDPAVFAGEYITEKIETKAGWTSPQPDEEWMSGYPQEIQDFVESVAFAREPVAGGALARDVTAVIYGAYLSAAEGRRVDLRPLLAGCRLIPYPVRSRLRHGDCDGLNRPSREGLAVTARARYCMACGSGLQTVRQEGRRRRRCPECNWTFYDNPTPAAVAIVEGAAGILLARRAAPPYQGTWDLPGGFLESGELPDRALGRELREELGTRAVITRFHGFSTERYGPAGFPILAVVYRVRLAGEPVAGSDVAEVRWFRRDAIPWRRIGFPSVRRALREYLRSEGASAAPRKGPTDRARRGRGQP